VQSSKPITLPPIPLETAKSARAVFGRSNFYLAIGDQAEKLFEGITLADPSGRFRKPPRTMARLYLITIFQFVETLPDHHAADALRERTDWKYALHAPLSYPGLGPDSFCEFRRWLKIEESSRRNLQALLLRMSEVTEFTAGQLPGVDAESVISDVCRISRWANLWEALHQAIEALAGRRPDWLLAVCQPHWFVRYGSQRKHLDLVAETVEEGTLPQAIGADGRYLLEAISKAGDSELAELAEVRALDRLWHEQFEFRANGMRWREEACAGCSLLDLSPHPP